MIPYKGFVKRKHNRFRNLDLWAVWSSRGSRLLKQYLTTSRIRTRHLALRLLVVSVFGHNQCLNQFTIDAALCSLTQPIEFRYISKPHSMHLKYEGHTFVWIIHISSQRKSMFDSREYLEMIHAFILYKNFLRSVSRRSGEGMIRFRTREKYGL